MKARRERMPSVSEGNMKFIALGPGKRGSHKISRGAGFWAVGECSEV